ncbi:MAG: radical SAM protein [Thermoplasmata archaeon]
MAREKAGIGLTGVHLLLTYKCTMECDHCFVWSSPGSSGTMTLAQINEIIRQSSEIPAVRRVYFEGGEPFLYYPVLLEGIRAARRRGFEVGVVSNAFWGTDPRDAALRLEDMARMGIADLSLSTDEHHGTGEEADNVRNAHETAKKLRLPVSEIVVRDVGFYSCESPADDRGELYFRGRAAVKLAKRARKRAWQTLDKCPEEPPGITRVHVDSYGNVQFCQGITIGNLWKRPLKRIMKELEPDRHPIIGPLMRGGPVALAKEHHVRPVRSYADACHMCYETRKALRKRGRHTAVLRPDQAYGEGAAEEP